MSRRSLRIDNSLLDRGLPRSSASFSLGGDWKNRSRSSRRLSSSCSESLLAHTPQKPPQSSSLVNTSLANPSLANSSGVHSVAASDASLLLSLLDESSIQESTAVNGFWGLDCDADPKESTVLADSTLIGPNTSCLKPCCALIGSELSCSNYSKAHCDCDSMCSSPTSTSSWSSGRPGSRPQTGPQIGPGSRPQTGPGPGPGLEPGLQSPEESGTIYCRGHRHKGVALCIRRWLSCFLSVLIALNQNLQKLELKDALQLWLDSSLSHLKRAALFCGSVFSLTCRQMCGLCAGMKESSSKDKRPNGALGADGRQTPLTQTAVSLLFSVMAVLWSATVFTACLLYDASLKASVALVPLCRKSLSVSVELGRSAGQTAVQVFRWIRRKWSQRNTDPNSRFPLGFVLFLLLIFAISFCLLWFGLSSLSSSLVSQLVESEVPFLQTLTSQTESTESTKPESNSGSDKAESDKPGLSREVQMYIETDEVGTEAEPASAEGQKVSDLDLSRLERLEQSLSLLWKQVEVRGQNSEPDPVVSGDSEGSDLDQSSVLQQQLDHIRTSLEQERRVWDQTRKQDLRLQQNLSFRLEQIQRELDQLSRRTQELELKQSALRDFSVPAPLSSEVESEAALFTELSRLQGALQSVTQDMQALSGCRGRCAQLQDLQHTVSVLVQEEVRSLVFGSLLASREDSFVSVLQFMSERFVSEHSLQGALSALEHRLMQHTRTEEERPAGGAVTQQEVQRMIHSALLLFSEDRTGLADYALESGGGSMVTSRCSQTFESKAAVLSLFGIPLWYFSQSPRTVIQPDVQPGNCWPFRGSSGFFLIRLSSRLLPSSFSLEHIPKSLSPTGSADSAPRDFSVYGLRNEEEEEEEGKHLGTFVFEQDGEALQTFTTEENVEPFQLIFVKVLSNWGHEDYTCIYRFRVHGTPVQSEPGPDQDQEETPGPDETPEKDQDQEETPGPDETPEKDQDQEETPGPDQTPEKDQDQEETPGPDQTPEKDQDQEETPEPDQDQDETPGPDQDQDETPGPDQDQDETPGPDQDQDETPGPDQDQDETPGPDQDQDETPGPDQDQDETPGPDQDQDETPGPDQDQDETPGPDQDQDETPGPDQDQDETPGPDQDQDKEETPGPDQDKEETPGPDRDQDQTPEKDEDPDEIQDLAQD